MVVRKSSNSSKVPNVKFVDEDETNPIVVAICSTENSYRLSWLINNAMSLNMALYNSDNLPESYSNTCIYSNSEGGLPMLITNKISDNSYFLPKLKKFDYLLILSSTSCENVSSAEIKLRKINGIIATFVPAAADKKIVDFVKLF